MDVDETRDHDFWRARVERARQQALIAGDPDLVRIYIELVTTYGTLAGNAKAAPNAIGTGARHPSLSRAAATFGVGAALPNAQDARRPLRW